MIRLTFWLFCALAFCGASFFNNLAWKLVLTSYHRYENLAELSQLLRRWQPFCFAPPLIGWLIGFYLNRRKVNPKYVDLFADAQIAFILMLLFVVNMVWLIQLVAIID